MCQQELDKVTAVLARFTSAELYKGVETSFSLFDIFFLLQMAYRTRS
jgi:hypothetical protein